MKKVREGYKTTELGVFPEEWRVQKFADLFERIIDKNKENVSNNVLTISAQKGLVNQEEFFNKNIASKNTTNYYLLKRGDFAYNKSYSAGYPMGAIKKLNNYDDGIVSPLYICFRKKNKFVNSEFYEHFFEYTIFDNAIASIAQEGARNHGLLNVSVSEFFNLPIIVPSIEEQEKIASILSTVDEQIDNVDALIEKNKELKKGLMQTLLTKGIGHTKFKKTEIGEIPEEWEVKKLNDIGDIITGNTPKTSEKDNYGEKYLWVSPFDMGSNKYIKNTIKRLSEKGFDKTRKLPKGSILVTCIGSTIGKIGIASKELSTNQQINSIICNKKNNNEFIYYAIDYNFNKYVSYISNQAVPIINKTTFSEFKIQIPHLNEQEKIALIFSEVDKKIEEYEDKKERLEELKKGLMQQLLTGKIRTI